MFQWLSRFLSGEIVFLVEGGRGERLLNQCVSHGITIQRIEATPTGFIATVPRRDYERLLPLAKKENCVIYVQKEYGAYLVLSAYRHRFGIFIGACLACLLFVLFSGMIWEIRFYNFTNAQIAEVRSALYDRGIYEGAFASKKDFAAVEKEIVIRSKDIAWITLNFIKGRLVVEKTDITPKPEVFMRTEQNVVAKCDGIIRKIDLSGGFLQVCEGQSVGKGDIMVSATRQDAGGKLQTIHVQAKIYADVEKTYEFAQPLEYEATVPLCKAKSQYTLYFLKKKIPLYKTALSAAQGSETVLRYPLTIAGFHLPVTIEERQIRSQRNARFVINEQEATQFARYKVMTALKSDLPEAQIIAQSEDIRCENGMLYYRLSVSARANIAEYS